ncbi:MAG: Nif3-like dinuclear metal center hexameric protein [Coriobacteriia bacterium]|nr:Nif3-like dinuclear metal center hexameric protein [Coriobacteriia bacterium]
MITIKELEQLLFAAFPAANATPDDRIGLLVGDACAEVRGIALALDAKVPAIEAAAAKGCNALITHHPPFWFLPKAVLREGPVEGAAVYRAAELGVSLITMHTNLDCSPAAKRLLLEPAGFTYTEPLSLPCESTDDLNALGKTVHTPQALTATPELLPSLGQLGVPQDGEPVSLRQLVSRYKETFGAVAKVWGDPDKAINILACCSGGGGCLTYRVINTKADCYVTGEVAYHEALALNGAGIALIELGHDRSELPYRDYLYRALLDAGIDESMLCLLEPQTCWWQ